MSHNISGVIKSIRDIMREDRGVSGDGQRIEQLAWMLFLKIFDDNDKDLELRKDTYKSPIPKKYQWRHWAENTEGITGDELSKFVDQELFPALRELRPATKRAYLVREAFEGNNNYMKSGTNIRKVLNKLDELDFNVATERHLFGEMYETILRELQNAGDYGEFYTPRAVTQFMTDMVNPKLGEVVFDLACGTGGFLTCTIEHLKKQIKNVHDRRILQETVRGNEYKPLPYLLAITNLLLHDIEEPDITYIDSLGRELTSYKERERVDVILANPPFGATVSNNNEKNFPQTYRTKESADLFLILFVHLLKDGGRAAIVLPDGSLTGEGIKQRIREKLLTDCNLHTIIRLPNSVFQPYATVATNLLFFTKGKPTKEVWYYQHRLPEGQKAYNKTRPIQLKEFDPIKKWWKKREESEICWKVNIDTIKERGFDLDIKNPTVVEEELEFTSGELIEKIQESFRMSSEILNQLKSR
ncbi:MAG: class I SAM-dependent DNA methyltransferase [Ignavibacteriales bacterium]|nr:class I SAM-dependent DNA methyltransferase [Ignavibacteriales bacterium]